MCFPSGRSVRASTDDELSARNGQLWETLKFVSFEIARQHRPTSPSKKVSRRSAQTNGDSTRH